MEMKEKPCQVGWVLPTKKQKLNGNGERESEKEKLWGLMGAGVIPAFGYFY
jgi:hypothetical protein